MQTGQRRRRRSSFARAQQIHRQVQWFFNSALLAFGFAGTALCVPAVAGANPAEPAKAAQQVDKLLASDGDSPGPKSSKYDAKPSDKGAEADKWAAESQQKVPAQTAPSPAQQAQSPAQQAQSPAQQAQSPAQQAQSPAQQAGPPVQKVASRSMSAARLPIADDETFIRRATLDLLGEQPSPEEITAFVLDPSSGKRPKLINRLLADPSYGHNWARYWRDVIFYRRNDDRTLQMAGTLVSYLTDEFNRNVAWDEIARSFITATGEIQEQGQTGLIMAQLANPEDTTAEVSRIFLGIQIQCAQCHNHPTDRWKREQFHELAAFFPRIAVRPVRLADEKRTFRVVGDDKGVGKRAPGASENVTLEHYMSDLQDPQAKGTLMRPVFFATGQKLELGASDHERRETLARWITSPTDHYFAEAFVNRMWSELVGHGFVEPVDDMGPDRPALSPQTLRYLAGQFTANHYDIKWLFRAIMSTDAYQRQSRSRSETADPLANSCPQRLRADQLANALLDALGIDEASLGRGGGRMGGGQKKAADAPSAKEANAKDAGNGEKRADAKQGAAASTTLASASVKAAGEPRKPPNAVEGPRKGLANQGPRGQALQTFGYDPSVRRDDVEGTIPQALWLMNGGLVSLGTNGSPATGLGKLLASEPNDESVGIELYLRCLAREPKPAELSTCLAHVKNIGRQEGFEDVLWSLLNSTEFLYRK